MGLLSFSSTSHLGFTPKSNSFDRIASTASWDAGACQSWERIVECCSGFVTRTCLSSTRITGLTRRPDNLILRLLSSTIRITPSAALRNAYGSLLPVGFSSIAQNPTSVSILSANATATDTGSVGTRSFGPCGL